jgi:hypothetical protein
MRVGPPDRFNRGKDWFRFHYHSRAATVGWFVGYAMLSGCPLPYVETADLDKPILLGFSYYAFRKSSSTESREKRQDIELNH